jgi:geranylgeranyl pyrophosphate synthase
MTAKKLRAVSTEDAFKVHSYFDVTENLLAAQLQTLMPSIREMKLCRQIEYALQTRGKHLRSALVLLSGECVGGNREHLQKLALAVELLHSASLVHDDILDREIFRRNALSVQAKWSVKEAILVGDALAGLALGLCRDYKSEVLDVMAYACLQLSDGEYMDIEQARTALSETDYFEKAKKKTGALFKAAAECGALAANGTQKEIEAVSSFGENYGVAFQIKDDVSDVLALENDAPADITEFCATLPIVYLHENAGKEAQTLLSKFASSKKKTLKGKRLLDELLVDLKTSGCLHYCDSKIDARVNLSIEALKPLKESSCKTCLIQMAEQLRLR